MSVAARITRKVAADSLRPYIDQALHDDELHARAQKAYVSGQRVYGKLRKESDLRAVASRLASDRALQEELRITLTEARGAAQRIGSRPSRRWQTLRTIALVAGVVVALVTVARRRTLHAQAV